MRCFFGWHKWEYLTTLWWVKGEVKPLITHQRCSRCYRCRWLEGAGEHMNLLYREFLCDLKD